MPRPNAAQLAYGSATVVCTTLVMLLLSGTTAGLGIAVVGIAGLGCGLLVALTVPARPSRTVRADTAAVPAAQETRIPAARAHMGAESRVGEHSLRS
jgi:hypothetical protein